MSDHAENVREYYRRQGDARTIERIIKLLDQQSKFLERGDFRKDLLIALIKGEQK